MPGLCKFAGIADQIAHHLFNPEGIANPVPLNTSFHFNAQLKIVIFSPAVQVCRQVINQ